jgi:prepilin-type N-terminal cleavage/methylation domain-containing protein
MQTVIRNMNTSATASGPLSGRASRSHVADPPWRAKRGNKVILPVPYSLLPARSGMTLIELLVVIVILTILVGAAIPLLSPTTSERTLREAARGLNTFIAGAQARAVGQSRPYGVALRRLSKDNGNSAQGDPLNDSGVSTTVFYVEEPPPFAGFDPDSRAQVALDPTNPMGPPLIRFVRTVGYDSSTTDTLPLGFDSDPLPPGLVRPGDVIEIGGTRFEFGPGPAVDPLGFYEIKVANPLEPIYVKPLNNTGQMIVPEYDHQGQRLSDPPVIANFTAPFWTAPAPYKILRQPMPTSDEPLQLPADAAIDLRASGIGDDKYFFLPGAMSNAVDNADDVIIMFAPEGRVSRVMFLQNNGVFDGPVVENIFLLVGPNVPPPPPVADDPTLSVAGWGAAATDADKERLRGPVNWLRGDSQWVAIGAASGRIATMNNSFVDPAAIVMTFGTPDELARNAQILAAREATRTMSQLGGR